MAIKNYMRAKQESSKFAHIFPRRESGGPELCNKIRGTDPNIYCDSNQFQNPI
jgi:hypothetical protein